MQGNMLSNKKLSTSFGGTRGMITARGFILAILGLVVLASSALAQTGGQGAVQGTVIDATGAVIPDATVTATNRDSGVSDDSAYVICRVV
jgi:hypothetical protein